MQPMSLANIHPPFQHTLQHKPKQHTNQETETDTASDCRPGQIPVVLLQRRPRAFLPLARLRGAFLAVLRALRRTGPDDDAYDSESDFAPEDQAARAARLRAERGWSYWKMRPFLRSDKKRQDEFLDHLMMASVSIFLVVFVAVLAMK